MLTNILATILTVVVTNCWRPTQYKSTHYGPTYPVTVWETWDDVPAFCPQGTLDSKPNTRLNPDVRITEVRRIRTVVAVVDGVELRGELSNVVISTKRERRVVKTDERWEVEP